MPYNKVIYVCHEYKKQASGEHTCGEICPESINNWQKAVLAYKKKQSQFLTMKYKSVCELFLMYATVSQEALLQP